MESADSETAPETMLLPDTFSSTAVIDASAGDVLRSPGVQVDWVLDGDGATAARHQLQCRAADVGDGVVIDVDRGGGGNPIAGRAGAGGKLDGASLIVRPPVQVEPAPVTALFKTSVPKSVFDSTSPAVST